MTTQELYEEGWHSIEAGEIPAHEATVEFCRDTAPGGHWFGKWADLDPALNVAGLWWRHV